MPYTEALPILTEEMTKSWHHWTVPARFQNRHILSSPEVLGPNHISSRGLRVWRNALSKEVQNFVRAALEVYGLKATEKLHEFFHQFRIIYVNENSRLIGQTSRGKQDLAISFTDIADKFIDDRIERKLAETFGAHLISSLEQSLTHMPRLTGLRLFTFANNYYYSTEKVGVDPHTDKFTHLLLHFSDPGTVYERRKGLLGASEMGFRLTAGDIALHGPKVIHENATAPQIDGEYRSRLCVSFQVYKNFHSL